MYENKKFNRWALVKEMGRSVSSGSVMYLSKCSCGTVRRVVLADILSGRSKSCGCFSRERASVHGFYKHPLYVVWRGMMRRCYSAKHENYKYYGARGIRVARQWHNLKNFISWGEKGYRQGLTIDRINPKKNYSPRNCRWASLGQQANNRTSNHFVKYKGENLTISEWGRRLGIKKATMFARLHRGWSEKKTVSTGLCRIRKSKKRI